MYKTWMSLIFLIVGTTFPNRDPFNPLSNDVEYSSGLAIRGIITSDGIRACVISSGGQIKTLEEGGEIEDITVIKINNNEVIIKKDGKLQTMVVK